MTPEETKRIAEQLGELIWQRWVAVFREMAEDAYKKALEGRNNTKSGNEIIPKTPNKHTHTHLLIMNFQMHQQDLSYSVALSMVEMGGFMVSSNIAEGIITISGLFSSSKRRDEVRQTLSWIKK